MECWLCGVHWEYPRIKCVFCEHEVQDDLGFFTLEEDEAHRVYFCKRCHCYLKIVDGRELERGVNLSVKNLATLYLDKAAIEEGFQPGSGLPLVMAKGPDLDEKQGEVN